MNKNRLQAPMFLIVPLLFLCMLFAGGRGQEILLANSKMSDKLQFVVAFGSGRVAETSDKLKFVGHFQRHFALLPSLPAVSQEADLRTDRSRQDLLSRLASGDEEQRIDSIVRIGALLRDEPDSVEASVITALGVALQRDSSPVVRALAARALEICAGYQGDGQSNEAVAALLAALRKERELAARKAIIYALARYPQPQVTSALIPVLRNRHSELRASAAYALAETGDPASAQALAEVLRRGGNDEDAFARSQAARGLGRVGGRDSIDLLTNALSDDRSQEVRREAARSLGRIATPQDAKTIEALRNATLSNDPYLVSAAEGAIASINSRDP